MKNMKGKGRLHSKYSADAFFLRNTDPGQAKNKQFI
jgi:hypothetical protein